MASAVGLELLYASIESQIRSQYDALVCCLHWNMIQNGFKCVGVGEEPSQESSTSKKSELLPSGWNDNSDAYILRYQPNNEQTTHVLKIIRMSDTLLVHVMISVDCQYPFTAQQAFGGSQASSQPVTIVDFERQSDERMCNMSIETSEYVDADHLGEFSSMFKNMNALQDRFKKELLSSLKSSTSPSATATDRTTTQRENQRREEEERNVLEDDDPLRLPNRRPPRNEPPEWGEPSAPFAIGDGDLDPFGGAGPGMFMDPMRGRFPRGGIPPGGGLGMPGRLPRGAIPPGARFDPIVPPHPDPSRNPNSGFSGEPDPDHLPPPGYDDMYM